MAYQFEIAAPEQVHDVPFAARKVVVEAYDVVSFSDQSFAEVRTDKAGTARYKHSFHRQSVVFGLPRSCPAGYAALH